MRYSNVIQFFKHVDDINIKESELLHELQSPQIYFPNVKLTHELKAT